MLQKMSSFEVNFGRFNISTVYDQHYTVVLFIVQKKKCCLRRFFLILQTSFCLFNDVIKSMRTFKNNIIACESSHALVLLVQLYHGHTSVHIE